MVTLKVLKSRLDSSNIFYGVLRVVKMTSMAKFNDIMKHAKVRDFSLRLPIRLLVSADFSKMINSALFGVMTNSGKCGAINVNIMETIGTLLPNTGQIMTYGKKGFSLCNKFNNYSFTIFESGSTSNRNLLIASRIVSGMSFIDNDYLIIFNRYISMTSRTIAYYHIASFESFLSHCGDFVKDPGAKKKFIAAQSSGNLASVYDYLYANILMNALFENDLSESSARIQSLETALKNLETIIENLRKVYNKRRQGNITNELLEVIASTISV